ncbi:MAG TPA: ATP-grasp domain-containing protein [Solirubrobacteraceae bacterium]|nr:ATP-grasp domain-containing protein [Solirubrobacteraceae bacterium]
MDAIVTDVDISSAVAGLRALGRRGISTLAVAARRNAGGLWSRYASARAVCPDVVDEPVAFTAELGRLASHYGNPIVYPGREEAINALLTPAREGTAPTRVPYADIDAVQIVRDKRMLRGLAHEVGLDAPPTVAEVTAPGLPDVDARFPFVVKPARPGGRLRTAKLVRSEDEVRTLAEALPPDQELLVQEYVVGPQVGVALVVSPDGTIVERFQHEVQRTWPLHGGGTSMATSVRPDEELVRRSAAMLGRAGYWGFAQLDLIRMATGYAVLDVNPRFYTSMPLAVACGVNLPAVWHDAVEGRLTASPSDYRTGVRYRWLEADLTVLRHRWRPLVGRRAGALWDGRDPLPGVLMAAQAGRHRVSAFVTVKGGGLVRGRESAPDGRRAQRHLAKVR